MVQFYTIPQHTISVTAKKLKMNRYVEKANETYRYEFWNVYELPDTIEEVRKLHRKYERKYNCERMHQSLNYLTPIDYYYTLKEKAAQSGMC